MAFSMDSGRPNGRRRGAGSLSEMNVVPLVDVLLVLLVIFMITSSVMEFGLEVEVPKVRQVRETAQELPVVSVSRNGELYLNETQVNINQLGSEIVRRFGQGQGAYLRADQAVTWGDLAQVVSALGEAKIDVKVVTQPEDDSARVKR
jgi:biopolymer transport protein ExbD